MKRFFITVMALLFSQQVLAASVAGIEFAHVADTLDGVVGTFQTNYSAPGNSPEDSIVDDISYNGATWVYSSSSAATLDVSFSTAGLLNVSDVDLTVLFIGDAGHSGSITLLGGSQSTPGTNTQLFSLAGGEGYTNFNSQGFDARDPAAGEQLLGIYAVTLDLDAGFSGTFSGVRLDIGNESAVPSMLGTTVAVVPVPAAAWLFGSGLLGLVGFMRRRR